jgi:hypothetical protein
MPHVFNNGVINQLTNIVQLADIQIGSQKHLPVIKSWARAPMQSFRKYLLPVEIKSGHH